MTALIRRLAVAMAALTLFLAGPAPADPLTAADFVDPAALTGASLSPSGRYLVWVVRTGQDNEIHIRDLETGEVNRIAAGSSREHFGGVFVDWVSWKSDDRLLLAMTKLELQRRGNREDGRIRGFTYARVVIAMSRDGSNSIALKAPRADDADPGDVLDTLQDDPDHILMTYRNAGGALDVARVNVVTGAGEKILSGHRRVLDYVTDNSGAVVGRVAYRGMTGRVVLLEALNADGGWSEVYRLRRDEVRDLPDYEFLGATADPGKIYVTVQPNAAEGGNTAGVHIFDFKTREMGPVIWRHQDYDVSGVVLDPDTHELLAGCYWDDIYRCDFNDRADNAVMNGIRRFFGEGWSISVVSQARDGSRWLVSASAPNNPGEYYLFNVAERRMDMLGSIYPKLPESQLGVMQRINYTASDGQALFGYLTRPVDAAPDAKLPLVVLPHGGPEMRDFMTYDMWVQFLTTRGYQVFQPNFRGSSGMGRVFAEAGYRQWGLRMQGDVTEGVEALIAQGIVDRGQVCIVGASYGGYAALQGGATQPDLYRCAISIAGPSDLMAMLRWERSEGGSDSDRYEYWVRSIGDPRADQATIEAASPLRRAADWSVPLLLIHGDDDDVVPVAQSRAMERALRRAGKPVRFVELEDAGHNGWSRAQEITVMTEMETFLGEHLPVPARVPAPVAVAAEPQAEAVPAS
jgi:dipeptidyl aminopeptidase/acylaminoacyl peptidase